MSIFPIGMTVDTIPAELPHAKIAAVSPPTPRPSEPIAAYAAVNERPVFSPSRRFAAESPPEKQQPPQSAVTSATLLNSYELIGVIIAPTHSVAFLKTKAGKETKTVAVGEALDGWRLSKVLDDEVVFDADGQEHPVSFRRLEGATVSSSVTSEADIPSHR
jgi:type II secretory pathway component PulC